MAPIVLPPIEIWTAVAPIFADGAVLLGNGVSQVISPQFGYGSLYGTARSPAIAHPLDAADEQLFTDLGTDDFEEVLEAMRTASTVNGALHQPTAHLDARYQSIKRALIESVHAVHIPWDGMTRARLLNFAAAMHVFRSVYTSNYDLTAYWAHMTVANWFVDYFWGQPGNSFDPARTEVVPGRTRLLFLHGGLHLIRRAGIEYKRVHAGANLLAQFGVDPTAEPLFISEGSSAQKLKAIHRSAYLAFAYQELLADPGPFVVLGHGLGPEDAHLAAALNRPGLQVAIGLRVNKPPAALAQRVADYDHALHLAQRRYFDVETHPLG